MKGSIHEYFQVGTIQWVSCPQRGPMESLETTYRDDFFNAIELKDYGDKNKEAKRLLEQSHLKVCYGAQPRLLGGELNPSDLDEEGRRKAEVTLIEAADEAECLDAKGIAFLAGKWQPETKDQAYTQLLKTTWAVYSCAVAKSTMVELEMFDYDIDRATLIGPTPYAVEFAADMHAIHSSFGLLVDLGHFPTAYETNRLVIRILRPYIARFHFGNVVVARDCDDYDDLYPRFGYPNSASGAPQLLDYLRATKEEGFFDAESPHVLSMGVTLRPGEDEDIVLANTKKMLNRTWALLEDNA